MVTDIKNSTSTIAKPSPSLPADSANTVSVDEQLLRRIVDEELEKKLAPLKYMLTESRDNKPGLRDILGGIGYILGLAGLFAWLKAKKDNGV
jgi:nickel transport protein